MWFSDFMTLDLSLLYTLPAFFLTLNEMHKTANNLHRVQSYDDRSPLCVDP